MVLERGEPGDRLSPHLKGRDAIGDPLLGLGDDGEDRLAQLGQRSPLRLLQAIEVLIDFLSRHSTIVLIDAPYQQGGPTINTGAFAGRQPLRGSADMRWPDGCRLPGLIGAERLDMR